MRNSIIVHGPQGCGKHLNAAAIARHFGLAHILYDQDPHALPPGIHANILILTHIDLTGAREIAGCDVMTYQAAATAAGVFAPVSQRTGD